MSILADISVEVRAEVRFGSGKPVSVGRVVTAQADENREEIRNTVTLAIRQINEEIKGLIR